MKLIYTATAYPPVVGGAQLHQHMLAKEMVKANHEVRVVSQWDTHRTDWLLGTTIKAPTVEKEYVIDKVPVHRIGLSLKEKVKLLPSVVGYYPAMRIALPKISEVLQPHLDKLTGSATLIHNMRIGRAGLSHASLKVARKNNIPFILTPVHHPRWVGWRYKSYISLYQEADAVIALTNAEKMVLSELGVSDEKIHVIGHGPVLSAQDNGESFRENHKISGPIVLFLGQHYAYKGYKQVLKSTAEVWKKVPDAQFVFIGPSVKQSEEVFHGFQDSRIHRLGKVSLQEKTDALSSCSLLCVPSAQESFGGVYTEAWAFSKPVVGCDIPAVSDVIDNGVNGLLVEQEPSAVAESILDLLMNPIESQKIGTAGKDKLEKQFSWSVIAEKLEIAYVKTLSTYG